MTAQIETVDFFTFDNSYARLPDRFFARLRPIPVAQPRLVRLNKKLAWHLRLDPGKLAAPEGVEILEQDDDDDKKCRGVHAPPYPRPAASGPRSEYQYGSFRTSTQRGSHGVSIMPESLKRCLDPCIRPPATHAEAFRSGVETCARQKTASTGFSRE